MDDTTDGTAGRETGDGMDDARDASDAKDARDASDTSRASDAAGTGGPGTADELQRLEAVFTGRVQGVFFRATTEGVARDLAVTGWVRNEPDGSVRLVAEGRRAELDRLLAGIREAKGRAIDDVACTWSAARGDFDDFRIRR